MAATLSLILSTAGFIRAIAFKTPFPEALTVTAALSLIVFSSICLGAVLPLFLEWIGVDPAHSSTTIQVVMDILGVFLAVLVSGAILDGPLGVYILGVFERM
jgi:Mg/Co/Ni transporter MgtE